MRDDWSWKDWVVSLLNTGGYYVDEYGYIRNSAFYVAYPREGAYSPKYVTKDEKINIGGTYEHEK